MQKGIQVLFGDNASGKTSVLEALHVVCSGKSFLGASPRKIQQFGEKSFSCRGVVHQDSHPSRTLQYQWAENTVQLKIGHQSVRRSSEYAAIQPVQAITPQSYRLIDDAPESRRKFIDWGVFHVKHDYAQIWHGFQKSLVQRNRMLAMQSDSRAINAWSREFVQFAEILHDARQQYLQVFSEILCQVSQCLLPENRLEIAYHPGWDTDIPLAERLCKNFLKDQARGFTYYGPQRAELQIRLDGQIARDSASRGQKKLITFALYLAQSTLQQEQGERQGILLIDDLPSELDIGHLADVMDFLQDFPMQIILSCIDVQQLSAVEKTIKKLFHVKHGVVKEVL